MRIAWLQHVPFEGLGVIGEWASERDHALERVALFERGFAHPAPFDMLVVMGGPMSVGDELEHPWLAEEKAFIRRAVADGRFVLGVCLGAQLLAAALDAEVTRNAEREIGWFDVDLTTEGRVSNVLGVLPERLEAFHWHGDTFGIPVGAVRTASSEACANQAFELDGGRVTGVQFHLEVTPDGVRDLVSACGSDLDGGPYVQSEDAVLGSSSQFDAAGARMRALLDAMVSSA